MLRILQVLDMLHGASANLTHAQKEYEAGQLLPRCVETNTHVKCWQLYPCCDQAAQLSARSERQLLKQAGATQPLAVAHVGLQHKTFDSSATVECFGGQNSYYSDA
jgi:hypothetical protein